VVFGFDFGRRAGARSGAQARANRDFVGSLPVSGATIASTRGAGGGRSHSNSNSLSAGGGRSDSASTGGSRHRREPSPTGSRRHSTVDATRYGCARGASDRRAAPAAPS